MKRCPYCARKTYYQGVYCKMCVRYIWGPKLIAAVVIVAGTLLALLILIIEYFAARST